jgi:hypothetical protein
MPEPVLMGMRPMPSSCKCQTAVQPFLQGRQIYPKAMGRKLVMHLLCLHHVELPVLVPCELSHPLLASPVLLGIQFFDPLTGAVKTGHVVVLPTMHLPGILICPRFSKGVSDPRSFQA